MYKKAINEVLDIFIDKFSILSNSKDTDESRIQKRNVAFELLSCTTIFKVSPYYAVKECWNANNNNGIRSNRADDGKIDGYFVIGEEENITVSLVQAKNTNQIKQNDIELFFSSINKYLIERKELTKGYESLEKVISRIDKEVDKYPKAEISYKAYISGDIDDKHKTLFSELFKNEFDNVPNVTLHFKTISDMCDDIKKIRKDILDGKYNDTKIHLSPKYSTETIKYTKSTVVITVLKADEIISMIDSEFESNFELSRLFSGNVRGFLDITDVNQAIKETIENSAITFLSKNNGVVIVCDELKTQSNKSIIIKNPIIVNGQQTVSTIYKYAVKQNQRDKILVMVKFIEIANDENKNEILLNIAKASNQSNSIDNLDLLSNRKLFRELVRYFGEKDIYLKIKDGELLNEIFLRKAETVKFIELLQIWVSVYLKRPEYAKTITKNIEIFTNAYNAKNEKYELLIADKNIDTIKDMFMYSYEIYKYKEEKIKPYFREKTYYKHAQYFIVYLLNEIEPGNIKNITEYNFKEVESIISKIVSKAKKRKEKDNKEFTYNNYFKSTQPQLDYLSLKKKEATIMRVEDSIEKLFLDK